MAHVTKDWTPPALPASHYPDNPPLSTFSGLKLLCRGTGASPGEEKDSDSVSGLVSRRNAHLLPKEEEEEEEEKEEEEEEEKRSSREKAPSPEEPSLSFSANNTVQDQVHRARRTGTVVHNTVIVSDGAGRKREKKRKRKNRDDETQRLPLPSYCPRWWCILLLLILAAVVLLRLLLVLPQQHAHRITTTQPVADATAPNRLEVAHQRASAQIALLAQSSADVVALAVDLAPRTLQYVGLYRQAVDASMSANQSSPQHLFPDAAHFVAFLDMVRAQADALAEGPRLLEAAEASRVEVETGAGKDKGRGMHQHQVERARALAATAEASLARHRDAIAMVREAWEGARQTCAGVARDDVAALFLDRSASINKCSSLANKAQQRDVTRAETTLHGLVLCRRLMATGEKVFTAEEGNAAVEEVVVALFRGTVKRAEAREAVEEEEEEKKEKENKKSGWWWWLLTSDFLRALWNLALR